MTSNIERLGIQESVEAIFPPSELAGYLSDLPVEVTVVDEAGIADCDAVVSTGIHGRTVGENVAGYLLAFARRLHDQIASATERRWERPAWDEAFTLPGTTACVVGTGTLGRGIADVVGPLGVRVTGVRRSDDPVPGSMRSTRPMRSTRRSPTRRSWSPPFP